MHSDSVHRRAAFRRCAILFTGVITCGRFHASRRRHFPRPSGHSSV